MILKNILLSLTVALTLASCGALNNEVAPKTDEPITNPPSKNIPDAHDASQLVDMSFGQAGEISFPKNDIFVPIAVQTSGKVVGFRFDGTLPVGSRAFSLARILSDGSADPDFKLQKTYDYAPDFLVKVTPEDQILVFAENVDRSTQVQRFSPDGELDNTFTSGGVRVQLRAASTCLAPDGKKIIFAGNDISAGTLRFVRLNGSGSFDQSFGSNGISTPKFGSSELSGTIDTCSVSSSGMVHAVLSTRSETPQFTPKSIIQLKSDGSLDPQFPEKSLDVTRPIVDGMIETQDGNLVFAARDTLAYKTYLAKLDTTSKDVASFAWSTKYESGGMSTAFFEKFGLSSFNKLFERADGRLVITASHGAAGMNLVQLTKDGFADSTAVGGGTTILARDGVVLRWSALANDQYLYAFFGGSESPEYQTKPSGQLIRLKF